MTSDELLRKNALVDRLLTNLRQIRFDEPNHDSLYRGDPVIMLPILDHTLIGFSKHLAKHFVDQGYYMVGKSDVAFCEVVWRLLRNEFSYHPALTVQQFLSVSAYAEAKLRFILDVIKHCKRLHNRLYRQARNIPATPIETLTSSRIADSFHQRKQLERSQRIAERDAVHSLREIDIDVDVESVLPEESVELPEKRIWNSMAVLQERQAMHEAQTEAALQSLQTQIDQLQMQIRSVDETVRSSMRGGVAAAAHGTASTPGRSFFREEQHQEPEITPAKVSFYDTLLTTKDLSTAQEGPLPQDSDGVLAELAKLDTQQKRLQQQIRMIQQSGIHK